MSRAATPALLALLLSACATTGARLPGPPALSTPEFEYEASFRASEPPAPAPGAEPSASVSVRYLSLDRATARALEGAALDGPGVWTTGAAPLAAFLRAAPADRELQPTTTARPERWTLLAPERQLAYVADFEFRAAGGTLLADPVIEIVRTGTLCRARGERHDDGSVAVGVELRDCGRYGPLDERVAEVPGFAPALTVQHPRLFTQTLATNARLAPDECLILSWNDVERPERRRFALVTAAPVPVSRTD